MSFRRLIAMVLIVFAFSAANADAEIIMNPVSGGITGGWQAEGPVNFKIVNPTIETTNRTGTITLNSDESLVTFDNLAWSSPAYALSFTVDLVKVDISVEAINIGFMAPVSVPVTTNIGPTIETPGFSPTAFTSDNSYRGTYTLTGRFNTIVTGSFDFAQNMTQPLNGNEIAVEREGDILSPITEATELVAVIFGTGFQTLYDGNIDGIDFKLGAFTSHSRGSYTGITTPVPEPTSFAMFGIAMFGLSRRRRR